MTKRRTRVVSSVKDGALRAILLAFIVAAGFGATARADEVLDVGNIQTSDEIAVGRLYGYRTATDGPGDAAFSNALVRAKTDGIPLLTVWSSDNCHYCDSFTVMLNTREAQDWMASQRVYFTYFKTGGKAAANAYRYAFEIGPRAGYRTWPAARLTWTPKVGDSVDEAWGFGDIGCSFRVFTNKVSTLLADYNKRQTSAEFLCGDPETAPQSRLDADAATTTVYVPLQIPAGATNDLCVAYPNGETSRIVLPTSDADAEEWVAVSVAGKFATAGETIDLKIVDRATDVVLAKNAITYVGEEATGTAHNPLWIGERTDATLAAGEWTLDLDVATNRTAKQSGSAFTLVNFGGELWCPDCIGTRTNLLETAAFREWAEENNVALALVDVPRADNAPSLMSHEQYMNVSGSPYLSRKGIDQAMASATLARFVTLAYETFNPSYEGRTRVWLPTFILLRKDGTPVAKYCGDRKFPNGTSFTVDDCIRRFDEMVALADDAGEWANNDWTTTQESVSVGGAAVAGTLSAIDGNTGSGTGNRVIDVFRVDGEIPTGAAPVVTVRGTEVASATVKLSLGRVVSGALSTPRSAIASGTLADGVTAVGEATTADGATFYAVLEGDDANVFCYSNKASSVRGYEIAADWCLVPSVEAKTFAVSAAGDVKVKVSKGSYYEFGSGTPDVTAFEPVESFWCAKTSGLAAVSFEAAGDFVYRQVKPSEWGISLVTGVASGYSVGVDDTYGTPVVGRVSGSLPKGLTFAYSASEHSVRITGVPSGQAGTYESTWRVAEKASDGSWTSWTVTLTCTVTELNQELNPFGVSGVEIADCPVVAYDKDTLAPRAVVGTLSLSVGANGRLKARYVNGCRSFYFPLVRGWSSADVETGVLTARFEKGAYVVDVSVAPDGYVSAEVVDPDYDSEENVLGVSCAAALWSEDATAAAWQGQYTVSLSPLNVTGFAAAGLGRGGLSLKMRTAADLRRGRISYSGFSPQGDRITGTARLGYALDELGFVDTNTVCLTVFKRFTDGRVLSGVLTIDADAAALHDDWPQSIWNLEGLPFAMLSSGNDAGLDAAAEYEALGGYYDLKESLFVPFAKYGEYQGLYDLGLFADDAAEIDPLAMTLTSSKIALMRGWANPNRVTFSFVRSTGLYSGSFQFTADGGSRCGRFMGVLMPGWVDCRCGRDTREVPFGMGGAWVPKKATLPAQSFTFDLKACE